MATNMWQQAEEMAKKHEASGGAWLKLQNDGDKAVVVFLGEPYAREVCFVDGKYVLFDEKLKAEGLKGSMRVALNAALYDSKEVKVFEQGVNFFKDLLRVREKYGLEKWAFEICRHGVAKDPKTSYSILPEHQLTPEQQKEFLSLRQQDLERLYGGDAAGADDRGNLDAFDRKSESAIIDAGTGQALATQLKSMPRDAVDRFCKKFGVSRIKDLPVAQLEKARAFVEVLASEYAKPAAQDAVEADPFA